MKRQKASAFIKKSWNITNDKNHHKIKDYFCYTVKYRVAAHNI